MAASVGLGLSCYVLSFTLLIPLCTDLELLQFSSKSVQESDLIEKDFHPNKFFFLLWREVGGWEGLFVLLWGFCLGFVDFFVCGFVFVLF